MRLTRSHFYFFLALLNIIIGVIINVSTYQLPPGIQPYLWLSWPILGLLTVLFIILSVLQGRPEPVRLKKGAESPIWKRRGDRKALRCYLEKLIEEHKYFTFLGRAKPLDLENIYIALKVGDYVPRQHKPDESKSDEGDELPKQRSGTVEVPEAVLLHRRLAVLGEPGSGKTTLLKYLALRIAKRDIFLGEFAREIVRKWLPSVADRIQKLLLKIDSQTYALICGFVSIGFWIWGLFHSPRPLFALLMGCVLIVLLILSFAKLSGRFSVICLVIMTLLLVYCILTVLIPLVTIIMMAIVLVFIFYPHWIQPPVAVINWVRDYSTCYPLPLYLTLNDLTNTNDSLDMHLALTLQEAGYTHPQQFLLQKLEKGECLILLDALDEVVDAAAYHKVTNEINRFAVTYHQNQIIVTCRVAGFRGLLQGFQQLEVQEFNEKQVELFIRNWFADCSPEEQESRVDGLLRCLGRSSRMRLLAANPLLVSIIALLYEQNFTLPERRVELYDECAQVLLEKREIEKELDTKALFQPQEKRSALQSIAAHFHQEGVRIFSKQALLTALAELLPNPAYSDTHHKEFLKELMERSGLLRQKSRTSFDFAHLTFQEFFTASAFHAKKDAESLLRHVDDPWWREVILLFVGLEDDATQLLELLRNHNILLAANALADARHAHTKAFERVAEKIIVELKEIMEDDLQQRQEAADTLAEIARWGAAEHLIQKAGKEEQPAVALAAVLGLAWAADKKVLDKLFAKLGPLLRLLNGSLGRLSADIDERISLLLEKIGFPMVFVPSGEFLMGSDDVGGNERPSHQVYLDDFWIDKYPVTNVQFQQFVKETDYQAKGNWRSEFTPGKENHPVVNVTWDDAAAFCEWAGKRLPTEAQWEKAARGVDGRLYPWGNQMDKSRCNFSGPGTTRVEQYPNGVSPYGCYDMAGNVDEWCADWYDQNYYQHSPKKNPTGPSSGACRVLRGASWSSYAFHMRSAYRINYNPYYSSIDVGFRCVRLLLVVYLFCGL